MIKCKKDDVILLIYGGQGVTKTGHVSLVKLLADPDSAGRWHHYMLIQINHALKHIHWPTTRSHQDFQPTDIFATATDIESIVNFKKDYVKAVFEWDIK